MGALKSELFRLRAEVLKPASRLTVVEWADEYRYLSPEASSSPGRWNTDLVEAARGPMLAVTERGVKKITVMGPTQLLKTEFINNVAGFFIHQDPAPMIVMQPIEKLAKAWSADRLAPMIRDTPVLRELIDDGRDSGNSILHKVFPAGHLTVVSAGSPSDVASRPVRVIMSDEVDKYRSAGAEGDPLDLLHQRTETFWNALDIAVCSPTIAGASKIETRFLQSDQRFFHGLCPKCHQFERLLWTHVHFESADPSTAHYVCSQCLEPWTEVERLKAISGGKYIATKPFRGHAGFHVNAIASPWQPLSKLAEKFIAAKKDTEKLKVFINTSLAETWKVNVEVPDWERLNERREPLPIGKVSADKDIVFLTAGADVQVDRIEMQVVGWTRDKQAYTIDYITIPGLTHTDEPWDLLKPRLEHMYPVAGSERTMPISMAALDTGFNTSKVYEFVMKFSPNRVRAVKGSDQLQSFFKMGSALTQNFDGTRTQFAHMLWMVGSSFLKDDIYSKLKLNRALTGEYPPGYLHFPEFDPEFFKQMTAEALVPTVRAGKIVGYSWEKQRARNEALDTFVYARAAASMFGLDRFTEMEWQALLGLLEPPPPPKPSEAAPRRQNPLWKNPGLKRRY